MLHNNAGIHETALINPAEARSRACRSTSSARSSRSTRSPRGCARSTPCPTSSESDNASIINAASTGSQSAYPNNSAYGTSKGGIRLQTQNLAVDLAPFGIRVNCYGPTAIATDMVTNYIKQSPDPVAFEKSLISTSLIPRLGRPEEVGELVCFLASPESSFINGTYILIDGGSLAWRGTVDALGM